MTLHTHVISYFSCQRNNRLSSWRQQLFAGNANSLCRGMVCGRAVGLYLNGCHPSSLHLSLTGCPLYLPHLTGSLELITKLALHSFVSIELKAAQSVQLTSKVRLYIAKLGNTNSFWNLKSMVETDKIVACSEKFLPLPGIKSWLSNLLQFTVLAELFLLTLLMGRNRRAPSGVSSKWF